MPCTLINWLCRPSKICRYLEIEILWNQTPEEKSNLRGAAVCAATYTMDKIRPRNVSIAFSLELLLREYGPFWCNKECIFLGGYRLRILSVFPDNRSI